MIAKQPEPPPGLPLTINFNIPAYWTPEQALAVFELLDNLRDQIGAHYVNSHPTPTPLSRPKMTPYRRANVPSEGAETGGAEPALAEQSRSWRAASGGLGD